MANLVKRDDGMLYIRDSFRLSDRPAEKVMYWPIERRACDIAEDLIGMPLTLSRDWEFLYSIRQHGMTRFEYRLGGDKQASHVEEAEIPAPKVRKGIETRWNRERWEKYSKREGWIPA